MITRNKYISLRLYERRRSLDGPTMPNGILLYLPANAEGRCGLTERYNRDRR